MIRKIGLVSGVTGALILGVASPASAGTLDQQQTTSTTNAGLFTNQSAAQTFTAGISGVVDQADLLLFKTGPTPNPVTVEIRNVSAGKPATTALASASIPISAITTAPATFVPVTFTTPAPVTAGTQYALVAYSVTGVDAVGWNYQDNTNVYPAGTLFISNESVPPVDGWNEQVGDDFAFRTYVGPAPPAPQNSPTNTATPKKKCKKKHKRAVSAKKCKKKRR
jgi:hypothetical protein